MLNGQAIAQKVTVVEEGLDPETAIYYIHSDHLGSTNALTDEAGDLVADSLSRFYPFGEYRTEPMVEEITDRGYTGHRENRDIGLTYMNARYYVPALGRFASADTIVPDPTKTESWNRFSYVENSPINFRDPSGHCKNGRGTGTGTCQIVGATNSKVDPWIVAKHTYQEGQVMNFGPQGSQAPVYYKENGIGPLVRTQGSGEITLELGLGGYLLWGGEGAIIFGPEENELGQYKYSADSIEFAAGQGIGFDAFHIGWEFVPNKIGVNSEGVFLEGGFTILVYSGSQGIQFDPNSVVITISPLVQEQLVAGDEKAWESFWNFVQSTIPSNYYYTGSTTVDEDRDYTQFVDESSFYIGETAPVCEVVVGCYFPTE